MLRLGKTERADVGAEESRNLWKYPTIASSRGNSWQNRSKLPKKILVRHPEPTFKALTDTMNLRYTETFPLHYPVLVDENSPRRQRSHHLECVSDTLEQRASNKGGRCAQMRWKEKGMAGNREERNEEEEGSGSEINIGTLPEFSREISLRFFTFSALNLLVIKTKSVKTRVNENPRVRY